MKLSTLIPSVLIGAGALTGLQAQNVQSTSADSTATVLEIKKETKDSLRLLDQGTLIPSDSPRTTGPSQKASSDDGTGPQDDDTDGGPDPKDDDEVGDTSEKDGDVSTPVENNEKKSEKKSLVITNGYAGLLTAVNYDTENVEGKPTTDVSLRTSIGGAYNFTKNTSLNINGLLHLSKNTSGSFDRGQAFLKHNFSHVRVNLGNMATSATLLRPYPGSGDGHFETPTQALIIGGTPGVRVDINPLGTLGGVTGSIGGGWRNDIPEVSAVVGYQNDSKDKKINLAGWYQNQEIFGAVLSGSYYGFSGLVVLNETVDQSRLGLQGTYAFHLPHNLGDMVFYAVHTRDLQQEGDQNTHTEAGLLGVGKGNINNVPVHITFGPGYNVLTHKIAFYLHTYLELGK